MGYKSVLQKFDTNVINKLYIPMPCFMEVVEETFNKSTKIVLENFLSIHKDIKKWMVFSDYVIDDKNKNNVITFSFIPYILDFELFKKLINDLACKDLKNIKNIDEKFMLFLKDMPIFTFSFIIKGKKRICYTQEKIFLINKFEKVIELFEYWIRFEPKNKEMYEESIKDFRILLNETKSNKNLKIKKDIVIISVIASYLLFEFCRLHGNIEIIGWFSDRDKVVEFGGKKFNFPILYNLANIYFHAFYENLKQKPELVFGKILNEQSWYDEFNRIPDYICGALADYNFDKNICSHRKHIKLIEDLIASNKKIRIFNLIFKKDRIECNVQIIEKIDCAS